MEVEPELGARAPPLQVGAVLLWRWRQRWSTFLRPLDLPAAFFFVCGRPAQWVMPWGRASWTEGDVLMGRWLRHSMGYVACSRR